MTRAFKKLANLPSPEAKVEFAETFGRYHQHHRDWPPTEIEELYHWLVFTILVHNSDDHSRTYGFLRTDRGGRFRTR